MEISILLEYGIAGCETINLMTEALKAHSMTLSANGHKFTISNSSGKSKEVIETILFQTHYTIWKPQVLNETDHLGNRLVTLLVVPPSEKIRWIALEIGNTLPPFLDLTLKENQLDEVD